MDSPGKSLVFSVPEILREVYAGLAHRRARGISEAILWTNGVEALRMTLLR